MITRKFFLLSVLGVLAAIISSRAFAQWLPSEGTFSADAMTSQLPEQKWPYYPVTLARLPRYGIQPRTAEELRQEKITAVVSAAYDLVGQNRYTESLARLRELDNLPGKTAEDSYVIERARLAAATRLNDKALMMQAAQALMATGQTPVAEQLVLADFLARTFYNERSYRQAIHWINRYLKEGGTDAALKEALPKAYYFNNEYGQAALLARSTIEGLEREGRVPTEGLVRTWISAASKLTDHQQYLSALEKAAAYHPKREYWNELLNELVASPAFSDRLLFDVYRFMYAAGQIGTVDDYLAMSNTALAAGNSGLAQLVIEQGFGAGILGNGSQASKHKALREKVLKATALQTRKLKLEESNAANSKSGDDLCNIGELYIDLGEFDKGTALLDRGIRRGYLKSIDHSRLRLGVGYALARRDQEALRILRQVQGKDGAIELARYWQMLIETRNRSKS
ncbi:MAG: repeat family protein [Paucimonas sp.]|nr:repeat family protein [Paucimonas sp.]